MRAFVVVLGLVLALMDEAAALPKGFVYLAEMAPAIRQDIRYAGRENFTGGTVPGYRAAECVLAREAALALKRVQAVLAAQRLGLKVFDCYRPVKAVRHFMRWAESGNGFDPSYHPRVDRKRLVAEGYIARRSQHSSGYTVDLTLTDADGAELDMGTRFDFFDPLAHTENSDLPAPAAARRRALVSAMAKGGFVNYSREWWHFSLDARPRATPSHDFDILPRGD
jgi:D-alanyl-D-alanine dipeptidase